MRIKEIIWTFTFLLALGLPSARAQFYTVDETAMGIGTDFNGSLDVMLTKAVNYANMTGNTATVVLNTGGLIPINAPLPAINHTKGKVIIKKATGDTDNEGIIAGGYDLLGFHEVSDAVVSDIAISNLVLENFKEAINIHNSLNVEISKCTFKSSYLNAIFLDYGNGAILVEYLNDEIIITENTFLNCNRAISLELDEDVETAGFIENYSGDRVEITNNTLTNCRNGFHIRNHHLDVFANYVITNNSMTANTTPIPGTTLISNGIIFRNPRQGYTIIDDNSITGFKQGIFLFVESHNSSKGIFGIDFIKTPNTLGLAEKNGNNQLIDCESSFLFSGTYTDYNVIGYSVEGSINIDKGFPSSIRECKIKKGASWTSTSFTPIDHLSPLSGGPYSYPLAPNNNIPKPTLLSAEILASTVKINYAVTGLVNENGPFVVEFFEVDPNMNIVRYLGKDNVLTAADASYEATLTVTPLAPANKVGATITSLGTVAGGEKIGTSELSVPISQVDQLPCEDCVKFGPTPGKRYWISGWVNVDYPYAVKTYEGAQLQLISLGATSSSLSYGEPTGEIIDGWQRIVFDFTIPADATYLKLQLNAHPEYDTYFDDIRIHPFNGSMKSYVYDGETFWLTSELDDNNYATFYEYDEEGGLVRIKKETARGIVTIQETRSNTVKQEEE